MKFETIFKSESKFEVNPEMEKEKYWFKFFEVNPKVIYVIIKNIQIKQEVEGSINRIIDKLSKSNYEQIKLMFSESFDREWIKYLYTKLIFNGYPVKKIGIFD